MNTNEVAEGIKVTHTWPDGGGYGTGTVTTWSRSYRTQGVARVTFADGVERPCFLDDLVAAGS